MKKTFWGDYNKNTFSHLKTNTNCEHLIVGGGVAGLFTAYFLLKKGAKNIVLIEKNTIGSGSTGHSAGMLVMESEQASWAELTQKLGMSGALAYKNGQERIFNEIKSVIEKNNIKCDLKEEPLMLLSNAREGNIKIISDFVTRKRIGLKTSIKIKDEIKNEFNISGFNFAESVSLNLSVNPLKFARELAKFLELNGVRIFENTYLVEVENGQAKTNHGNIAYKTITTCTGTHDRKNDISVYLTTIAITNKLSSKEIKKLRAEDADMFIDSGKRSFHYGRFTADKRMLVGYGDLLKKDTPRDDALHIPHFKNIERFIKKSFPNMNIKIEYSWSSRYAITKTHLPVVEVSKNFYRINGAGTQIDSAMCSDYVTDKILKNKSALDKVFNKKS